MPRFDGTGPRGTGPMTGRGEGYCVVEVPEPGKVARGYAELQGTPVRREAPVTRAARWLPVVGWWLPAFRYARAWAARRGRGRGQRW